MLHLTKCVYMFGAYPQGWECLPTCSSPGAALSYPPPTPTGMFLALTPCHSWMANPLQTHKLPQSHPPWTYKHCPHPTHPSPHTSLFRWLSWCSSRHWRICAQGGTQSMIVQLKLSCMIMDWVL